MDNRLLRFDLADSNIVRQSHKDLISQIPTLTSTPEELIEYLGNPLIIGLIKVSDAGNLAGLSRFAVKPHQLDKNKIGYIGLSNIDYDLQSIIPMDIINSLGTPEDTPGWQIEILGSMSELLAPPERTLQEIFPEYGQFIN